MTRVIITPGPTLTVYDGKTLVLSVKLSTQEALGLIEDLSREARKEIAQDPHFPIA